MNQAINFFWTILCFAPVAGFWMGSGNMYWCYAFIGLSTIGLFIPARMLQLSNSPLFYERFGVRLIRRFVQNGDLVNRYLGKQTAGYKVIKNKAGAANYIRTVIIYERYHLFCFWLFLFTMIYELFNGYLMFAVMTASANIIYNLCPVFLQQYNRIRIKRLVK